MLKIDRTVRVIVHFCGEEVFSGTEAEYANWRKMVENLLIARHAAFVKGIEPNARGLDRELIDRARRLAIVEYGRCQV